MIARDANYEGQDRFRQGSAPLSFLANEWRTIVYWRERLSETVQLFNKLRQLSLPLQSRSLCFKRVNDLSIQAAALFFRGPFQFLTDVVGHVLEGDSHESSLQRFRSRAK